MWFSLFCVIMCLAQGFAWLRSDDNVPGALALAWGMLAASSIAAHLAGLPG